MIFLFKRKFKFQNPTPGHLIFWIIPPMKENCTPFLYSVHICNLPPSGNLPLPTPASKIIQIMYSGGSYNVYAVIICSFEVSNGTSRYPIHSTDASKSGHSSATHNMFVITKSNKHSIEQKESEIFRYNDIKKHNTQLTWRYIQYLFV